MTSRLLPEALVREWAENQAGKTPPWSADVVERILRQLGLRPVTERKDQP